MNTVTDKRTRDNAIPFEASTYTNSSSGDVGTTDAGLIKSSTLVVPIRCSVPSNGVLTEAHLNLLLAVNSTTTVKVGIGRFDTDGIAAIASYTDAEIAAMHQKLTGSDAAISSSGGNLFIDGLNILPLIPKRGSTNYNQDGFVVLLQFSRARSSSNDILKQFNVMCSAQMGLL